MLTCIIEVVVNWNDYLQLSLQPYFLSFFVIQTIEVKNNLVSV